ncbi:uncharacterized protein [Gorilla gorilla gorilla]|uniref:uncharacterized protein isoform X2 n=1 Tax=Gorilla gorilla gorilla TaxID=9595 RepID=UPI003009C68E
MTGTFLPGSWWTREPYLVRRTSQARLTTKVTGWECNCMSVIHVTGKCAMGAKGVAHHIQSVQTFHFFMTHSWGSSGPE